MQVYKLHTLHGIKWQNDCEWQITMHVGYCGQESAKKIIRNLSQNSQSLGLAQNVNVKQK
jgi:hypothetical protein